MQVSYAQSAANAFVEFNSDPASAHPMFDIPDPVEYQKQFEKIEYLSDFLELWLISGLAHKACRGSFSLYAHAMALIFAEMVHHPGLNPLPDQKLLLAPSPTVLWDINGHDDGGDSGYITAQQYVLPGSLTRERFDRTADYTDDERVRFLGWFITNPTSLRFDFNDANPLPEQ